MKINQYNQMMSYLSDSFNPALLRSQVATLEQREGFATGGTYKDYVSRGEEYKDLTFEEWLQEDKPGYKPSEFGRVDKAIGGGAFVGEELPNNREGFSELYGPNIRKLAKSDTLEVNINRGGKNFYKTFSYGDGSGTGPKPSYATKEEALEAATKFRDSLKNLPKTTGKGAKGRPAGFKPETGQSAEIRRILNQFISEGKTSYSNKDIKELIDKDKLDLFETDRALERAIDRVKKEPEFKNLNFADARSLKEKGEYFTDSNVRKIIKENYGKVKQKTLAKLAFPDEPLTTSKTRLGTILSDMADKGEIERLKVGEFSEERSKDFDPSPEAEKRARITKRRRKKIDILGSKDYEKELFEFKKQVQENLGLEKVKEGKYDPIDMGHQSSITQLKALRQKLRPEDLNPQFYKANQLGIKKYEGGVKTLESALDRKYYPEQKKLYKQAQKFINAGNAVPEDLQNKIIKSNEDIQKFINETVEKYPLLKDRVNAITIDPINLNVKRGDNIFRQLGIGLVDKDLGDIKIGSIDDLTIKANLAQQTLQEAVDAGLIDKNIGQQKLNEFLNVQDIVNGQNVKNIVNGQKGSISTDLLKDIGKGVGIVAKPVLKTIGSLPVAGTYAGMTIKENLDEGKNIVDATVDPLVGVELLLPETVKRLGPLMAKAARLSTPVGTVLTGLGTLKERTQDMLKEADRLTTTPYQENLIEDYAAKQYRGYQLGGRVGFADGPDDPNKRSTMKILGGLASLPLVGRFFDLAQIAAPVAEKAVSTAQNVPSYFFKLINKIKKFGKDETEIFSREPREQVTTYRTSDADYELYEDLNTGSVQIKIRKGDPDGYSEYKEQELTLTKSQPDESTGAVSSDYDEYTVRADTDGKMKDIDEGLEDIDDLIEELGPENISVKELEDMGYDVNRLGPTIKKKLGIK